MDITIIIGFFMLVIFLIAVIILIWKDNRNEKRFWKDHK
jgi:hypothetical protein